MYRHSFTTIRSKLRHRLTYRSPFSDPRGPRISPLFRILYVPRILTFPPAIARRCELLALKFHGVPRLFRIEKLSRAICF